MAQTFGIYNEQERLAALERYHIMDTEREREFDDIVAIAAEICDAPMALISLVDEHRQWFKAAVGLSVSQTPRGIAFCALAIQQREVFLVEDASKDPRFEQNPLVVNDPNLRFYAGAPLMTSDGFALGTLCVLDSTPRGLSVGQERALRALSRQVMSLIELRRQMYQQRLENDSRAALLERQVEARVGERNRLWTSTNDLMGTIGRDGRLKEINPAWSRLLGWSDEEILARHYVDLIPHRDRERALNILDTVARDSPTSDFSLDVISKGGAVRNCLWSVARERDDVYIVGRDITAQQRAEARLRQSAKMDAVGQLTGGIAHDFNNLLAGILGSIELLDLRVKQGRFDALPRHVDTAKTAAKRAAALTHRLLAFSRQQTLEPKAVTVSRLVAEMEELVRRTIGPGIQLEVIADGGLWPVLIDPNQLENAILNLCINSRDAMPNGGRLTIQCTNCVVDSGDARESEWQAGEYVSISVRDTGEGMTPEVIANAFDPFFTTKPTGAGTGLGLSMVYGFAHQSGGHVRIASDVGKGTTLRLYLPRHRGDVYEPEHVPGVRIAPRTFKRSETVLIVDDEPSVRMVVAEVLSEAGYRIIEAADGPTALQLVRSTVRIDLLITDIGLPGGLNGRQVAESARRTKPELKILFITGYAETAVFRNGTLAPGMHMLTKPFAIEALSAKVSLILDQMAPAAA